MLAALKKVQVTRERVSKDQIQVDNFYMNLKSILSDTEIKEIGDFIKENMMYLNRRDLFIPISQISGYFNLNMDATKKFVFLLVSLKTKSGRIFRVVDRQGTPHLKLIGDFNAIFGDVKSDKPKKEEEEALASDIEPVNSNVEVSGLEKNKTPTPEGEKVEEEKDDKNPSSEGAEVEKKDEKPVDKPKIEELTKKSTSKKSDSKKSTTKKKSTKKKK